MNSYMKDYNNLKNAFYNIDDSQRAIIGTNFMQVDEVVNDFLVYKGLIEPPKKKRDSIIAEPGSA